VKSKNCANCLTCDLLYTNFIAIFRPLSMTRHGYLPQLPTTRTVCQRPVTVPSFLTLPSLWAPYEGFHRRAPQHARHTNKAALLNYSSAAKKRPAITYAIVEEAFRFAPKKTRPPARSIAPRPRAVLASGQESYMWQRQSHSSHRQARNLRETDRRQRPSQ